MALIAGAGLAGGLGAVGSAAIGGSLASLSLKTVLGAALVSAGSTAINLALQKSPQVSAPTLQLRQPTPSGQFAFGLCRVSGVTTFVDNDGEDLWGVLPIACHEIDAVLSIWDGENLIWEPAEGLQADYVGKTNLWIKLGTESQIAIPELVAAFAELDEEFRGRGNAYIAFRLVGFAKNWGGRIPALWAQVNGARPFDPRTGTASFSHNWALNVSYYLQHPKGGNKSNVNSGALIASANISDEEVPDNSTFLDLEKWPVGNDGTSRTHRRYELNGAFSTASTPKQILAAMIPYGVGDIFESAGEYHIHAGAYSTPVAYFTKADFLEVPQIGSEIKTEDEVDGVRARYSNPTANFAADDAPDVIFNTANPSRFLDNLDLTAESHPERAQRIMALMGRKTMRRLAMAAVFPVSAMAVEVGDRVNVDFHEMGISSDFEVRGKSILLSPEGSTVSFDLLEDSPVFWAWSKDDAGAVVPSSKSTLPSSIKVEPPTNLVLSEVASVGDGNDFENTLRASFDPSPSPYVSHHVVKWTVDGATREKHCGNTGIADIENIVTGQTVDVEIFAVNNIGVVSSSLVFTDYAFDGRRVVRAYLQVDDPALTTWVTPSGYPQAGELEVLSFTVTGTGSKVLLIADIVGNASNNAKFYLATYRYLPAGQSQSYPHFQAPWNYPQFPAYDVSGNSLSGSSLVFSVERALEAGVDHQIALLTQSAKSVTIRRAEVKVIEVRG